MLNVTRPWEKKKKKQYYQWFLILSQTEQDRTSVWSTRQPSRQHYQRLGHQILHVQQQTLLLWHPRTERRAVRQDLRNLVDRYVSQFDQHQFEFSSQISRLPVGDSASTEAKISEGFDDCSRDDGCARPQYCEGHETLPGGFEEELSRLLCDGKNNKSG